MLKVLIVDDEKLIRQDLKSMIDWAANGFEIVGDVGNGLQAINTINSKNVDIVITDIYMPVLDGVELIKRVKSEKKDIKFLVISNYDDYRYVKDAMKYGASDYILKYEIDHDNLLQLLNAIKDEIRASGENRRSKLEELWKRILIEQGSGPGLLKEVTKINSINGKNYVLLLIDCDNAIQSSAIYNVLACECENGSVVSIAEKVWCVILWHEKTSFMVIRDNALNIAKRLLSVLGKYTAGVNIVVGNVCGDIQKITHEYACTSRYLEYKFYYGPNSIIFRDMQPDFSNDLTQLKKLGEKITQDIILGRQKDANENIHELFNDISNKKYPPGMVYDFLLDLLHNLNSRLNLSLLDMEKIYGVNCILSSEIKKHTYIQELKKWLGNTVDRIMQYCIDRILISVRNSEIGRKEIKKVIDYMHQNYMKELTLDHLANYTGFSKNYFCRLFKEEVGEGFIDCLNRIRVEMAKYYLSHTNDRISDIAAKVGIKEYRYFCNIFKKLTGVRPNEYKRKGCQA
ncbi:MAG: response regulator [Bacillota bacterium]